MSIEKLTEMSNRYGAGETYVLAGGGNTSYKENGVMYVKGSGTSLRTVKPPQFVAMDMAKLSAMLQKEYPSDDTERESEALKDMMAARLPGEEAKRPSVEAILHALFPQKYVLHTHPALINGLSCGRGGAEACARLFGNKVVWVPLTKPGYILATVCKPVFEAAAQATGAFPGAVILQNHGLFVAADTVEAIDAQMAEIMAALTACVKREADFAETPFDALRACKIAPALRMLYAGCDQTAVATFCVNAQTMAFVSSRESMAPLMASFTPDHIVYCKHAPLFLERDEDLDTVFATYVRANGFAPKIVAVRGLGFFALGRTKKEVETARVLFLDAMKVAVYAEAFGGYQHLPDDFTRFILDWEIESYRQKVALLGVKHGLLDGKIAIVTGSAQGFGQGIAQAMAAEGAYVAIADLNGEGARACAGALVAEYGAGYALAIETNVADETSVEAMVQAAVLAYGGLDVLISNAGIVISGGLEEMTKQKFDLVTQVNYTGYFLCAKYAARPMRIQRQYQPDLWMDIIEINSKSGLEGSNRNFAYAGSKFGGIGLTQSLALELVGDGIKVNAVCPGNLLDGPLWSDPEKGLFKQYLDAGKVPGAKTVEDVRRFYEAKVPMNRGCQVRDVVRAIFYIIKQQYETGQALPVTGGQVMLH